MNKSAVFSDCNRYRFLLARCWDESLPTITFIGLNPSTANANDDDPTIRKVIGFARRNGYGMIYMCNCFPIVSTDPSKIVVAEMDRNFQIVSFAASVSKDVLFAWGNFEEPVKHGIAGMLSDKFPDALCLGKNKNGSPKHPLYVPYSAELVPFKN